jgi:catechol 2,3-dioxygenase-like lactoylglutathione lyase family enzyme
MTLRDATPVGFIHTRDLDRARSFYATVLDLDIVEETPFALVVRTGPIELRVTPVPAHEPLTGTVFGWTVDDIEHTMRSLLARDVVGARYPGLEQDPLGIWQSPGPARVAWFDDPDGNTLSVTQH